MCSIYGCNNKAIAKGLCTRHYCQKQRLGRVVFNSHDKHSYKIKGSYAYLKDKHGNRFLISISDLEKVLEHRWIKNTRGYVVSRINGKCVQLHRFILEPMDYEQIDHINQNPLDNRRENLRVVNNQKNQWNKKCTNKFGIKGIRNTSNGRFKVEICINYKTKYIGTYDTLEEAINARKVADELYHKI